MGEGLTTLWPVFDVFGNKTLESVNLSPSSGKSQVVLHLVKEIEKEMKEIKEQKAKAGKLLSQIALMIDPDAKIAGGAPRNWDQGKKARDIDIYLHSNIDQHSNDWLTKSLEVSLPGFEVVRRDTDSGEWDLDATLLNKVVSGTYEGLDVELMFTKPLVNRDEDLMRHFDTGINRIWAVSHYGEICIHRTKDYQKDVDNKTLTLYLDSMTDSQIVHCLYNHLPKVIGYYPNHELVFSNSTLRNRKDKENKRDNHDEEYPW